MHNIYIYILYYTYTCVCNTYIYICTHVAVTCFRVPDVFGVGDSCETGCPGRNGRRLSSHSILRVLWLLMAAKWWGSSICLLGRNQITQGGMAAAMIELEFSE